MIRSVFKSRHTWLLTGLTAIVPYLSIEANHINEVVESAPSIETSLRIHRHRHHNREQLRNFINALLVNQTVFFHDYAFSVLGGLTVEFALDNDVRLRQNAAIISQTTSINPLLLTAYVAAGENYVNIVNATTADPTNPITGVAFQEWLSVANQLAINISQIDSRVVPLEDIQHYLQTYTILLAGIVNDLASTALNTPNLAEASLFYTEARAVAARDIAPLLTLAAVKSDR